MMESITEKTCLYCGKTIRGRTDKKFCNDYCRNYFNHRRKAEEEGLEKKINQILAANRRILQKISASDGFVQIEKERLLSMGFDNRYCTGMIPFQSGNTCFVCYEYAFFYVEKNKVVIFESERIRPST